MQVAVVRALLHVLGRDCDLLLALSLVDCWQFLHGAVRRQTDTLAIRAELMLLGAAFVMRSLRHANGTRLPTVRVEGIFECVVV